MTFDPRTIAAEVYQQLSTLRGNRDKEDKVVKQQKSQATELYTYLSTWGLLRLKAEEEALKEQEGKKAVVTAFFKCLGILSSEESKKFIGRPGLQILVDPAQTSADEYLGLTGLGLSIAQEFGFWATAIYADVKGEE
ncbi:hypothetical protein [Prochlorothrix hollandica]|uniref:CRISPR type III-B/RAMP module-associated protein Cmr5 n=1 Tax=Prochlorothrix hollandica PCC 9006 = CALU 1027 TaxID=317619 RepID=A0A0M2PX36_PROHO|nr:hypothetical protein [Prochlorothrix hollandica]KKI99657.1 hypothetical protein PROH_07110 [Prochlorothrix hollandica PCC 9006 = CALU 1027]